jgi:16S rRNA (guanine966-N2)-methyltransferase
MPGRAKKNHRGQKSRPNGKKNRTDGAQTGSFRVIGGEWRSRKLSFPALEGLRPTTDRVKETVFNWLMPHLPGARVLDLFAGSGSLGIEALSRDALFLVSVEKSGQAAKSLQDNYFLLGISNERGKVENVDALSWLKLVSAEQNQFDVVFLDPPFRQGLLDEAIALLDESQLLAEGAVIYLEREKEGTQPELPKDWVQLKEKVAGQVSYQLFQRQNS